jgi:hypothetical protein
MTFSRSLVFAALAGTGVPLILGGLGPLLGHAFAMQLYLVGSAVAYAAAMAPNLRRATLAAAAAGTAGTLLLALPLGLPGLAVGSALVVALCRSGLLHQAGGLRGIVLEGVLQAAGLLLAAFLADRSAISLAVATWGYFLVQSLFFLVGGIQLRRPEPKGDAFDEARMRLLALLD